MIGSMKEEKISRSLGPARYSSLCSAGAIIPMDAQAQTGVDLPEMLDWHLFPGDNRSFVLVEGEGASKG